MFLKFKSVVAQSPKYRPEIDGLRAIAILPVVLYHAGIECFSGGFVGVDIFFVISGYLITSIIAKDIQQNRFSFATFYERRIRRIFPALFAMALFCVIVAAILFIPKDFKEFSRSLMAMTVFASNLYFRKAGDQNGYFGNKTESAPLLHTWSLAVEEQFYIFFPIALLLLHRYAKKHETACLLLAALASFAISAWGAIHKPLGAFYLLPPRSWELLIGAFLALKLFPPVTSRALREIAGVVGIALIAYAVFVFTKDTDFPGANALFPCVGAWLIIYTTEGGDSFTKRALSFTPLVFIGVISYSLYLWHWPMIVFTKIFIIRDLNNAEIVAVIATSFMAAFISFEFIESPFRGSGTSFNRKQIFRIGAMASVASLACALIIYSANGLPARFSKSTFELVQKNAEQEEDFDQMGDCVNFKKDVHSLADVVFCKIAYNPQKNILFWGDSHVQQVYPLIKTIHEKDGLNGEGIVFMLSTGCPPTEHMNHAQKQYHCDRFASLAMQRALQPDINTVYIGFSTWWALSDKLLCDVNHGECKRKLSMKEAKQQFLDELSDHIRTLKSHGKNVIVSLPFPIYDKDIPKMEIHNTLFDRFGFVSMPKEQTSYEFRDRIKAAAVDAGAIIFDPRSNLCDEKGCKYQIDGVSMYKDNNHIVNSQIGILEDNLRQTLEKADK